MLGKKPINKKFKPFLALAAVALILIVLERFSLLDSVKGWLQTAATPSQLAASETFEKIGNQLAVFSNIGQLREKVAALEQENALLKAENSLVNSLKEENALLKKQLGLAQEQPGDLLLANIIGSPPFTTKRLILLDKGSKDGVEVGDLLIIKNVLLGTVVTVGPQVSSVRALSDPDSKIPAETQNNTKGILVGEFQASIIFRDVINEEPLSVGDTVFTSGDVGLPKGLVLGEVVEVKGEAQELFKEAKVKQPIDVSKIRSAFIVLKKS